MGEVCNPTNFDPQLAVTNFNFEYRGHMEISLVLDSLRTITEEGRASVTPEFGALIYVDLA